MIKNLYSLLKTILVNELVNEEKSVQMKQNTIRKKILWQGRWEFLRTFRLILMNWSWVQETRWCFCSDGLTNMVDDDVIEKVLQKDELLNDQCQELIAKANENGGNDNITVLWVAQSFLKGRWHAMREGYALAGRYKSSDRLAKEAWPTFTWHMTLFWIVMLPLSFPRLHLRDDQAAIRRFRREANSLTRTCKSLHCQYLMTLMKTMGCSIW